jgi:hypothetical protein
VRQVAARAKSLTEASPEVEAELTKVHAYVERLNGARAEANQVLGQHKQRLSHVEDHMRRLHMDLQHLAVAANELDAMEVEHYDDRAQAEREIERLEKLIAEGEAAIETLKREGKTKARAYALVPYEGPNGTFRRPIYVECHKDEVILQPEGTRISRADLQPPLGPGNALASAIRAARDHLIAQYPDEGKSPDTEPYPMLIVRPEGAVTFGAARRAIEAADFEFGYEPVETDWKLEFGAPNPQIAHVAELAVEQARARQKLLAAAAPRAYSNREFGESRRFEEEPTDGLPGRFCRSSGDRPAVPRYGAYSEESTGGDASGGGFAGGGSESGGVPGGPASSGSTVPVTAPFGEGGSSGGGGGGSSMSGGVAGAPPEEQSPPRAEASEDKDKMSTAQIRDAERQQNPASQGSRPAPRIGEFVDRDPRAETSQEPVPPEERGNDWAWRHKGGRSVPVRRAIHVVVRANQLAIVPDGAPVQPNATSGRVVPMEGDTVLAIDEFVEEVKAEIDGWGIAGE